jgi:hypothetical protein
VSETTAQHNAAQHGYIEQSEATQHPDRHSHDPYTFLFIFFLCRLFVVGNSIDRRAAAI